MPRLRPALQHIDPYRPGRPISAVARELGIAPEDIVKLASNESPLPPFPEVQEAISAATFELNRYPDNDEHDLAEAVAARVGVEPDHLWFGGGSTELLSVMANALGGPDTSAVYAWPAFIIYRLASLQAGSRQIEVPLAEGHRHDLEAMAAAVADDTSVVFICNPNNPTGTHVAAEAVSYFLGSIPEDVVVVIDEAYHEFVTASDYATAVPQVLQHPNLVVTRTFSKVYGLAALRLGYAVADPELIKGFRRAQNPFTVNSLAQVGAIEALRHPGRVAERSRMITSGRDLIEKELTARGIERSDSQANFVYFRIGRDSEAAFREFLQRGVIVRPFEDGWLRVTVGTEEEDSKLLAALDDIVDHQPSV
ncbi:MAG TPA: histidinol-phosphate transaminase [Acidimicrobiia bacterium]